MGGGKRTGLVSTCVWGAAPEHQFLEHLEMLLAAERAGRGGAGEGGAMGQGVTGLCKGDAFIPKSPCCCLSWSHLINL